METETYSDYVAYEITSHHDRWADGPNSCPACGGDLSRSEIEPSRAMYEMLWDPKTERYKSEFTYLCSRASFLYTCNECRWWCVRDACDFLDDPERPFIFCLDYLILGVPQRSGPESSKPVSDSAQPWLKALDDPDVYAEEVVRDLPDELAAVMFKPAALSECSSVHPRMVRDLAEFDPFIERSKSLIVEMKARKLQKIKPLRLFPGDKVRVTRQTFGRYRGLHSYLVIARWNIGTVLSHDDFRESRRTECAAEKEWMEAGTHYPIRLETSITPPATERAFLETLHKRPYIYGICNTKEKVWLIDADSLEKITVSEGI